MSAFCSLGSQYFAGFVTGGALGWIFSQYLHKRIVRYITYLPVDTDTDSEDSTTPVFSEGLGDNLTEGSSVLTEGDMTEAVGTLSGKGSNIVCMSLTNEALSDFLKFSANLPNHRGTAAPESPLPETAQKRARPDPVVEDELTQIFESESTRQTRSVAETLDVGRKFVPPTPVFPTSTKGGYMTMGELSTNFASKPSTISRADELELINLFRGIVGMPLNQAQTEVSKQGYSIWVLYCGMGEKMPAPAYSSTLIGVRIKDEKFNPETRTWSPYAVVTEIIDVGGVDAKDRGKIRL